MRILKRAKSLSNLALRALTLVFRFALSFYIVKFLGLEASGLYGLALGVVATLPAVIGWGLNYFVARDIVGKPPETAGPILKTRLLLTTVSLLAASIAGLLGLVLSGTEITHVHWLILALIWLETYGLDVHIPLIAQEMAVQANIIIFLRSAVWVPLIIAAGFFLPVFRSIEWVFGLWILSYIPTAAILVYFLRRWPLRAIARAPLDTEWLKNRLKGSWLIYISDISLVGLMYADRYIVNFLLGLTLTGVYTFFWSLTNALQTLISTAVVQLALPVLFKAFNTGSMVAWRQAMARQFVKTAGLSVFLGLGVFAGAEILLHVMNMGELAGHRLLFLLMLLAAIVRSCSDLLNIGLTSMQKDRHYAMINLLGVCLTLGLSYVMIDLFGLIGAGIAAIVTSLMIAGFRAAFLLHFARAMDRAK